MPRHEIAQIALTTARCCCGWTFRNDFLKNKSDEDLAAEAMAAYEAHIEAME